MHDLVIRGATVVDGLGHDPIRADVAVRDGRIVAIGEVGKDATKIVDAGGLALMPGIIDLHTHYDAQVTWDPTLSPSPSLGVTTAIIGNCGFGIVPSPPHLRDLIMRNLAVVEGMDLDALRTGIDWRFQSFAEYITMLRGRGPYMNLGVLVGHSAVRTAVMGEDASLRKEPTAREAFAARLAPLRRKNWFVYAKPPFAGPEAVLAYLARYTHRVAISNSRLVGLDQRGVTFRYKDYRRNGRERFRTMTLAPDEFIRRF